MTLQEFSEIFALLAVQLRATDADEATIRGYFRALEDIEPEFIAEAAQRMAKRGGALDANAPHWFPKTSEWRAQAAEVERDRHHEHFLLLQRRMKAGLPPLCLECSDTGWRTAETGASKCDCRNLRRLEILGRRPWPMLPAAS